MTWDVYQQNETGTLALPPKPSGASFSETFFTTVKKGTVRLFESGTLIQTKANGNKPPCQVPGGAWPQLTTSLPAYDTTKLTIAPDGDTYFRVDLKIRFKAQVGDAEVASFLAGHGMTVLGVTTSRAFFVRIPDPGTSDGLSSLVDEYLADARVETTMVIRRGDPVEVP